MASNIRLRLQKPFFGTMSSKNINLMSDFMKSWPMKNTRILSTRYKGTLISNTLKARQIQFFHTSNSGKLSQLHHDVGLSTINLRTMFSSGRSLASTSKPDYEKQPSKEEGQKSVHTTDANEGIEETLEEHEETIYKGILSTQIKLVKSFSLLTSAIGLSCQPILLYQMQNSGASGNIALALASGAFLSFFTFATPLLIHWVSKKYVTELLYNKIDDTYTAITYSLLLQKKKINFKVSEVKIPDIPSMFTTIIVGREKGIPLFVDGANGFSVPQHYVKLMGYDKPLDLRWNKEANESQGVVDARRKKGEKQKRRRLGTSSDK